MSRSLWDSTASELLQRASSGDPTPGGGAIAAVAAAFGVALVRMALEVTISSADGDKGDLGRLADAQARARELQAGFVEAADRDVAEFEALMAGYRMPRGTDDQRRARRHAIDEATVTATRGPLDLAEAAGGGLALADEVAPLVKRTIVSDVQAGRDLLRAAALAALRTAEINLAALEESGHPAAAALR
ncbi:MAG: cyclodeaminase/cyclohydrolase family protein, partial [Acidobacteriota bacterium]|nr:cyclodeaminase/cyclohydrolase family protein [Acidobacteriota bacterium]